ncbi:MAG: hypothetical protein AAF414_12060 [Pseudomonadota bacterium]
MPDMAGFKRQFLAETMSDEGALVLGALASRLGNVFCQCQRCGHASLVEAVQLMRQLGPEMAVAEVGTRMRCSGCGAKDVATLADDVSAARSASATGLHLAAG